MSGDLIRMYAAGYGGLADVCGSEHDFALRQRLVVFLLAVGQSEADCAQSYDASVRTPHAQDVGMIVGAEGRQGRLDCPYAYRRLRKYLRCIDFGELRR